LKEKEIQRKEEGRKTAKSENSNDEKKKLTAGEYISLKDLRHLNSSSVTRSKNPTTTKSIEKIYPLTPEYKRTDELNEKYQTRSNLPPFSKLLSLHFKN
jgi:hypothetical protein